MTQAIRNLLFKIFKISGLNNLQPILDILINESQDHRKMSHPNPFVRYGKKCFSQNDEDGITLEILNRIGISKGSFIEFGVGDGTENNTLLLLSLGWKGYWFGNQELAFSTENSKRLTYVKTWVTKENIVDLCRNAQEQIQKIDLISLDLDGNDYYLVEKILENNITPKIFIIEYNAKFFPPIEFIIDYKADHSWAGDDYFGASLTSFNKLFERFDYSLVCCNSTTGSNAFFVKKEFMHLFSEVPSNISDIFCSPFYFLPTKSGHKQSLKTIEKIINDSSI